MANEPDDTLGANLQQGINLNDPRIRNGLFSMAAQFLTPSWSKGIGTVGPAMGAFGEGAGNTEQLMEKQSNIEKARKQAADIAAEHNATQKEVAQIHADALKQVAQTRGQFGLQKGQNVQDSPIFRSAYTTAFNDPKNLMLETSERHALAMQQATEAVASFQAIHGHTGTNVQPGQPADFAGGGAQAPTGVGAAPAKKATATAAPGVIPGLDLDTFKTSAEYRNGLIKKGYGSEVTAKMKELGLPMNTLSQAGLPPKYGFGTNEPLTPRPGSPLDQLMQAFRPKGAGPTITPPGGQEY